MGGGELRTRIETFESERERRRQLALLRKETLKKIEFLRKKAIIETHDVYNLIKQFFKEFLSKRYEFTITELRQEIRMTYINSTTRKMLDLVLEKLSAVEYASVHYKRDELIELLDIFKDVVQQLVKIHSTKKSVLTKLRHFFFKGEEEPEVIIAELPATESNDAINIRMHLLIEKCYVALDKHNFRRAKSAYTALLDEYAALEKEEKQQFYPLIDQTYQDILNRTKKVTK